MQSEQDRGDVAVPTEGPDVHPDPATVDLDAGFACPRCGRTVSEEFYGPCTSCRTTLRMSITADARNIDDVDYEPKMNVTPNAVALKD